MSSTRSELVRRIARSLGLRAFRGHWNLRELLDDCESSAFELDLRAGPHVKPGAIAFLAVKRVKIGRQFKESVRSLTTSRFDKRSKRPKNLRQIHVHLHDIAATDAAPSDSVPGWIDYQEWLKRYDARKRGIAEVLALGSTTGETARHYGVSDGRISQMRREFERDWKAFQGEN